MIRFTPIPTQTARACQSGAPDANRQKPERHISDGDGNPCRHCLKLIPKDGAMLVLAHRPFPAPQPYAELGPIFLCARPCAPGGGQTLPAMLDSADYITCGYGPDDRTRLWHRRRYPDRRHPRPRANPSGRSALGRCPCPLGPEHLLSGAHRPRLTLQ